MLYKVLLTPQIFLNGNEDIDKIQDRHFHQSIGGTVVEDFSGSMFSVGIKVNFSYVKVSWMFWGPERGPII